MYLDAAISAAQHIVSPGVLLGFLATLPIALFSGLMPGGSLPFAIVVLGFATLLDPWVAMSMIVFYHAASDITSPIPSILLGIPGSRSAQATVLDGYPMAKRGEAGVALGASYITILIGGVIGGLVLLASIPFARQLIGLFGSAEFFLLAVIGVITVAVVSAGAMAKGILAGCFALAIAMIGDAPLGGSIRAAFGIDYLWDGLDLGPVAIGLFAIPETLDLVVRDTPVARTILKNTLQDANKDVLRGMLIAFNHKWLILRAAIIGTFVGALPGIGGSGGHWIAYAHARATEKGAMETFGKGDIRGVIASDAANNSSDGGALITTLFFGIPGTSGGAFLIAIMLLSGGILPGASMLNEHLDLTIGMVYAIVIGNVFVVPVVLLCAPLLARLTAAPPNIVAPIVIGLVTISAFLSTNSLGDLVVVLVFGVIGIFMKAYGWPRPPMLIALVLATPVERYFSIAWRAYDWEMFLRPQFLFILALMALVMFWGSRQKLTGGAKAGSH